MTFFRVKFIFVFLLIFVIINCSYSSETTTTPSCKSMTFLNNQTFNNCIDLPTLKAILHYTYDPTLSTISIAFTTRPPTSTGWVAWALNPKDLAMAGAQTLIAYKPNNTSPITVYTMDIKSYKDINLGPISYNVTDTSAQESNGDVTIFATWAIPRGETSVNTVWQVGPIINGHVGKHDFNPDNLNSKLELNLVNGPIGAPMLSPIGAPTNASVGGTQKKDVVSVFMVLVGVIMVYLL